MWTHTKQQELRYISGSQASALVLVFHLPLKTKYSEIASGTSGYGSGKITWGEKRLLQDNLKRKKKKKIQFFKRNTVYNFVLKYMWGIAKTKLHWRLKYNGDGGNQLMGCFHTTEKTMHNFQRHPSDPTAFKQHPCISRGSSEQNTSVFCLHLHLYRHQWQIRSESSILMKMRISVASVADCMLNYRFVTVCTKEV